MKVQSFKKRTLFGAFFDAFPTKFWVLGVSWTMDNFRVRFMDNFIVKIVKIVHGQFLIFIQTYGNPKLNPNP